eukprot:928960-Rhodomonas_salina.1
MVDREPTLMLHVDTVLRVVALLCCCVVALLCGCVVVLLCCCVVACLCACVAVLLRGGRPELSEAFAEMGTQPADDVRGLARDLNAHTQWPVAAENRHLPCRKQTRALQKTDTCSTADTRSISADTGEIRNETDYP